MQVHERIRGQGLGLVLIVAGALISPSLARAEHVLQATHQGYLLTDTQRRLVTHDPTIAAVGSSVPAFAVYRENAYVAFDLSAFASIGINELVLEGSISDLRRHLNADPYTTFQSLPINVFDVSTPLATLRALPPRINDDETGFADALKAFDDLGSGTLYTSFTVDNGIPDPYGDPTAGPNFTIPLDRTAVLAAQAALAEGRSFVLGFSGPVTYVDGLVGNLSVRLRVRPVPEPGSALLMGLGLAAGLGALGLRQRRRSQRSAHEFE